ncbi:hypothetical protein CN878_22490 [Ochrobactrum sp. 695/2009]|nr:DUF1656 domain-containing protein [Brucella intermedia]PJR92455.1 hypothetical protein CN881_07860 [Ochrobactrum sp. 721/2009]PJT15720.1 hypothetical protein CN880_12100 [Ochrobactrum sp. 720/2009]PJT23917.1 hypothetical protein CN879_08825 [Ochrobactrum sp. 715/2009]PJT24061.1 hypothetical protein CN878_22490 [Ochrobactrum sp. 695/2009]PJT33592.1 hypothetical protein CN877_14165 [Ochrobactrum sp. 689/2009]
MIADLNFAGVLIPALVVFSFLALVATLAMMRILNTTGVFRLFAYRPLVELAIFVIVYGLLMQVLSPIGLLP